MSGLRPRLWFDHGEADRFKRTLDLMPKVLTAKVRYAEPDGRFRLSRIALALQEWKRRWAA